MKKMRVTFLGFIPLIILSCTEKVNYIDKDFPGKTPKLFAEGIINLPDRFQQNLTMSPDGNEYYFTQTDSALWRYERILRIQVDGNSIQLDTPKFVKDFAYENEHFIGEPMLSPDNQSLFFVADYPPDIWEVQRAESGDWASPFKHPMSTDQADWYVTFFNEDLLFTNGTAYTSSPSENYQTIQKLSVPFNGEDIRDPVMATDESFLIFTKAVPDSNGPTDLMVSFQIDGKWSTPRSLGDAINTDAFEGGPYISPDQKFLFFGRRDKWQNATFSNIYWVSLDIIEELRP